MPGPEYLRESEAPKPKSLGGRLKWVGLILLLCVAALFVWRVTKSPKTSPQPADDYRAAVAEVERTDPDWNWERLNSARKRPPAGQNAAELISKIHALAHRESVGKLASQEWSDRVDIPPNLRFAPAVIAEARRELAASAEAVKLARTLKDFPLGHREFALKINPVSTSIEETQYTRSVTYLIRWDLVLALEDGDQKRTADDLLALLNSSRSIGDEPFTISQLVRVVLQSEMIRSTEWALAQSADVRDLAVLQTAIAANADEPLLLYALRGERAQYDRMFENVENGSLPLNDLIDLKQRTAEQGSGWEKRYRERLPTDRAFALRWLTRCVELARLPVHEQPELFATLPSPPNPDDYPLSSNLEAIPPSIAARHWLAAAEARCAVVGIACERFRQQHKRWPNALIELVPAFVPAVPIDPYNAKPLRLAKLEDSIVVYSGGQDLRGDGGALEPTGTATARPARFRLWNPEHRRRAPLPEQRP